MYRGSVIELLIKGHETGFSIILQSIDDKYNTLVKKINVFRLTYFIFILIPNIIETI